MITPTASFSFGSFFNPIVGARLHFNGIWNKGGYDDFKYDYKYLTSNLDLMINLVTLFGKKNYYPLNVYLIGGIGLNYAWDNDDAYDHRNKLELAYKKNQLSHNARVGAQLDYNISKHFSVNLEVAANSLGDRYNSKRSNRDDWQLTAQLGVAYKFGVPHKVKENPTPNIIVDPTTIGTNTETESANTKVEIEKPQPKPEPVPTPVVKDENITRNIFFSLRGSEITAKEQTKLAEVATWLKEHPTAKVTITGYADKGTGNATINARYAKQRAEAVAKELTNKYGIEVSRITTDSKGDTVQPFKDENDKNRVTIVIGKE